MKIKQSHDCFINDKQYQPDNEKIRAWVGNVLCGQFQGEQKTVHAHTHTSRHTHPIPPEHKVKWVIVKIFMS